MANEPNRVAGGEPDAPVTPPHGARANRPFGHPMTKGAERVTVPLHAEPETERLSQEEPPATTGREAA